MPAKAMRIRIRGVTYDSAKAAGQALGVATGTVYTAISRGSDARLGLGQDYKARVTKGGVPPIPVTVAGQTFPSMAALGRALGRNAQSVKRSIDRGGRATAALAQAVRALDEKSQGPEIQD